MNQKSINLLMIILGLIVLGSLLVAVAFHWLPLGKPPIPVPSGNAPQGFFETLYGPNPIEALQYCDKYAPFQTGGDPPAVYTKASCYCAVAKQVANTDCKSAIEICKKIANFSSYGTGCDRPSDCLKQLPSNCSSSVDQEILEFYKKYPTVALKSRTNRKTCKVFLGKWDLNSKSCDFSETCQRLGGNWVKTKTPLGEDEFFCDLKNLCEEIGGKWKKDWKSCDFDNPKICEKRGGIWVIGPFGEEFCEFLAPDAGEECTDSDDCLRGRCLAQISDEEAAKLWKDPRTIIPAKGKCAERSMFGCFPIVKNGKAQFICIEY